MACKNKVIKAKLEKLYLTKRKSPEEISKELNLPLEEVKEKIKLFRLDKSLEIEKKRTKIKRNIKKVRTKEECLKEFRKLKRELHRTPMLKELPLLGKEGLKRDILKHWGAFSDFLKEGRLGIPKPKNGVKNKENFKRLASEAAIRYYQKGKWSKSELKIKRILEEEIGLIEELDFWHNFRLKSPTKGVYELDFYLPRFNLVIEADSFWHDLGESKAKDKLRDEWIKEKLNCRILRFNKFTQKGLARIRKTLKKEIQESLRKPQKGQNIVNKQRGKQRNVK
ncbi:hypothetical protein DRH14_03445 [Candidatus Shapirobacteria bacterium]|nr:MAG: hypothetical protein DRH14_03445 [Candidatus Shapirobacteria bacterium]